MGVKTENFDIAIKFVEDMPESVITGTMIEFGSKVMERTPVDTGFARNSWTLTKHKNYTDDNGLGEEKILDFSLGESLYLNNGANYINKLEDGTSTQAPQGMVRITLPEIPYILQDQIRDYMRANR